MNYLLSGIVTAGVAIAATRLLVGCCAWKGAVYDKCSIWVRLPRLGDRRNLLM